MITLGHYLKPYSKRIALGTVIKIVGTITELFLPWILSYMIDEVAPEKNVARIFLWGAVMLACAVVALLGNITANRMASKVAATQRKVCVSICLTKRSTCRQDRRTGLPCPPLCQDFRRTLTTCTI